MYICQLNMQCIRVSMRAQIIARCRFLKLISALSAANLITHKHYLIIKNLLVKWPNTRKRPEEHAYMHTREGKVHGKKEKVRGSGRGRKTVTARTLRNLASLCKTLYSHTCEVRARVYVQA